MSGILLPGQEKQPRPKEPTKNDPEGQSSSGIILPSGYSSKTKPKKKEEASPRVEEEQAATASEAEQQNGPQGGSQGGQPQMNFKYPPSGLPVQCPSCGNPFTAPVFSIIDFGANPELRQPLLGGQINVALCPSCGVGGPLGAPLMIHDPENEFLGVFVPQTSKIDEIQRQKIIGDMTRMLMRGLAADERRGYMLQPQQFFDWNRLLEKIWGFEGVTPEMLRRQRDQSNLIQQLLGMLNDETALDLLLERNAGLIDRDLFTMLEQMLMMVGAQGQEESAQTLSKLYTHLLEKTPTGAEIKERQEKVRGILEKLQAGGTREDLLNAMIDHWDAEDGREIVGSIAMAAAPLIDYEFLMALTKRFEQESDVEVRGSLTQLREFLLQVQEQSKQSQEAVVQQTQQLLQKVLQATDTAAALKENAHAIDETFLSVLAANIQAAQQKGASAAAKRLEQVYHQAVALLQEKLPPEIKLIQQLLAAPDSASGRKILQENRELLTPEFVQTLTAVEKQFRESDRTDDADRLKSLRGQVALML